MKKISCFLLPFVVVIFIASTAFTQTVTTVTGNVKDNKTKESLAAVSVTIKGGSSGAFTDDKGNFKFTTTKAPPFTLVISINSYESKEVEYTSSGQSVNIEIQPSYALLDGIVIGATRMPTRILEAPVTIERINAANIRNAPGESYYATLGNLKGVDVTTSSYTFKTVSTRGFNGSGNLRFNQFVDGMDNTLPALNFSVGNVIGLTELDVDNMELLTGASSALYGSGGTNGTLLINSKDPFKYQGVSFQVKAGIMHVGDSRHSASPFYDWSLRWGEKVSEKFAFKFGAQYTKADDWQADDKTNLLRNNVISNIIPGNRESDPNYDGVNVFGDEASSGLKSISEAAVLGAGLDAPTTAFLNSLLQAGYDYATIKSIVGQNAPPLLPLLPYYVGYRGSQINPSAYPDIYGTQAVSRTGYDERDLVDYGAHNLKFSGGLYFKINDNTEASLTGNWGSGTSVYTGADRYSLKNFKIGQYKLEFKSTNWFLRAYTTQENSGDSYASTLTALAINNAWQPNGTWFGTYDYAYSEARLNNATIEQAHQIARGVAETGRALPGSKEFNDAFNKSVTTSISKGGSQFADKSNLYQVEGQLNLTKYIKVVDVLVGASYRLFDLNSAGTIFVDTAGHIKVGEYGGYLQLQKSLFAEVLKLTGSLRYDKSKNFNGRTTPRITASIKVAKDNHIRLSYQQAYRFPNNQDQYIKIETPGTLLIGCLPQFNTLYNFTGDPVYNSTSVDAYRKAGGVQANPVNAGLLVKEEFRTAKPETMESYELGYRGIIAKKLVIDAYVYSSKYKDFIARTAVARGEQLFGDPGALAELTNPLFSKNFSFVTNSPTPVKATGWGISADLLLGKKGYKAGINFSGDQLKDVPAGLITFFNTPKFRYNLSFANANFYNGLGFNLIYKWQDEINWEGTFGAGKVPAFGAMDASLSYKPGKSKNLIKLGATNLFNKYYRNAFGNPYIGGLYYVSFGYNVF